MNTAIVYYSLTGNVECAAGRLAEALGADLIRLEVEKAYPRSGFRKFLWGGKSAVMAESPALVPCAFHAGQYDRVVFGAPVWAGTFAPPLRSFIRENRDALRGKRLSAFLCSGGGSADKAFARLLRELGADAFEARLALVDPKDRPTPENDRKLREFCEKLLMG